MLENVKQSFLQEQAEKNQAREHAASLEERLKEPEEENASLKLAADEERSGKDRLLALLHSLTGWLFLLLTELLLRFPLLFLVVLKFLFYPSRQCRASF